MRDLRIVFIRHKAAKSSEGAIKGGDREPETNAGRQCGGCRNERVNELAMQGNVQ